MTKKTKFPKRALCALLAMVMLLGGSFAYFSDYVQTSVTGTAGTVDIELNSNINLLDADGKDIINPGDNRDASFEIVNMGNKSVDVKTEVILSVVSNFDHDLVLSGDSTTQSEYDLYYADDVELVEGEGWKPKEGATPIAEKEIAQDGKSITYKLPVYALNGNSNEHGEVETVDGVDTFINTENIVMLMNGQAGNLWQNSTVSIAVKVYAKQHENTSAGWDLVSFEAVDNAENGEGNLVINAMTPYGTRVSDVDVTVAQVIDNGAAVEAGEGQFDVVEVGSYTTTKTEGINIENLKAGTYVITATSAPSGYTVENEVVVVITKDRTTNKTIFVGAEQSDNILYNTIDVDGNKLANVGVVIESTNEYGEFKTNKDGVVVLDSVKANTTYTITAPESVNELPIITNSSVRLTAGNMDTAIYGIEKDRVYASIIGDTMYVATYEIPELDGVEATYIREITKGWDASSYKTPVVKVVVVDEVQPLSTRSWFLGMSNLVEFEGAELINMSKATNARTMFYNCSSLASIGDISNWDVSNVVNMTSMFSNCVKLEQLDLSDWDTSNVRLMANMFQQCEVLTALDLSDWDVSNVVDMGGAFLNCRALTTVGDLSNWDVSNVVDMGGMFAFCQNINGLNVSSWNTEKVTSMAETFYYCSALTELDLTGWKTENVTTMYQMFNFCMKLTSVGDLSGWNTAKVTNMYGMFGSCKALTSAGDLNNWDVSSVTNMKIAFGGTCGILAENRPTWYA